MSDSKIEEYKTLHNMTEKHATLYDIFCKSRAEMRAAADPEDESRRKEFLEAGLKGGEVATGGHQALLLTEEK